MRRDLRTSQAAAYRKLYKTAAWQQARKAQLSTHPLCIYCQQEGKIVPATVVNHRKPHKGDWDLFISAQNHESTCAHHHNSLVQSYERTGRMRPVIALDGWPQPTS